MLVCPNSRAMDATPFDVHRTDFKTKRSHGKAYYPRQFPVESFSKKKRRPEVHLRDHR